MSGSISGVSPTATASAKSNAPDQPFVRPFTTNTIGTMMSMNVMRSQLTLLTPLSKLVRDLAPVRLFAIDPK